MLKYIELLFLLSCFMWSVCIIYVHTASTACLFVTGGAMLIGAHLLEGLTSSESSDMRLTAYLMSALVGYVIFMLAVFNIYPLRYHKGPLLAFGRQCNLYGKKIQIIPPWGLLLFKLT